MIEENPNTLGQIEKMYTLHEVPIGASGNLDLRPGDTVVMIKTNYDPEGSKVRKGDLGVVWAPENHYGDSAGPMVTWIQDGIQIGVNNVYPGTVKRLGYRKNPPEVSEMIEENPKPKKTVNLEKALKKVRGGKTVIIQPGSKAEYNELLGRLKKGKFEYVVLKKDVKGNIVGLVAATTLLPAILSLAIPAVLIVGGGYLLYKHAKKKGAEEAIPPGATVVPE